MVPISHDDVYDLGDRARFIQRTIHIMYWDWLGQVAGREVHFIDIAFVNKVSCGSSVSKSLRGNLHHCVGSL